MGQAAQPRRSTEKPLDDLTYDLVTILHAKSKALEAYDKYLDDARGDDDARKAIEAIRDEDVRAVEQLKSILAERLTHGSDRAANAVSQDVSGHPKRSGAV